MLNRRERLSMMLGGMAGEILLEAAKIKMSIPLINEGIPISECTRWPMGIALNASCNIHRLKEINSSLAQISIMFSLLQVSILITLIYIWWKYANVRSKVSRLST